MLTKKIIIAALFVLLCLALNFSFNVGAVFALNLPPLVITEVTPVPTPTNDNTPDCTFNVIGGGAGNIIYGGECSSAASIFRGIGAAPGWNNIITFNALSDGVYDNCTIQISDLYGRASNILNIPGFTVDTVAPSIVIYTLDHSIISPNGNGINDEANFDLRFSEEVGADFNILDASGVKVRDIYDSPAVTNPQSKKWDGKNNSGVVVPDGIYTIQIIITDPAGNNLTDVSKTITVDSEFSTHRHKHWFRKGGHRL
jgi:hypothetical protein